MAQTHEGAMKTAAKRAFVSTEDFSARTARGEKICWMCRVWKPLDGFGKDRTRFDGKDARCSDCRVTRTLPGPSKPERQRRRAVGQAWCKDCADWLPVSDVRGGRCKPHINAESRAHYASDAAFRSRRKAKTSARKRGVDGVPIEGEECIIEQFNGRCAYCGAPATTWDHIEPVSRGGMTTPGNIAPACLSCNSSKGDKEPDEWLARSGKRPCDEWFDRVALRYGGLYG